MAGEPTFPERRKRVDQLPVKEQRFRPGHRPRRIAASEGIPGATADANSYYTL